MAEVELYKVSSSCSEAVDNSASDNNGNFGERSNYAYGTSLPGPSSGPLGSGSFSSDSSSGMENDDSSMVLLVIFLVHLQAGHLRKCVKWNKKPTKTWKWCRLCS